MAFLADHDVALQIKRLITDSRNPAVEDAYREIDLVLQERLVQLLLFEYFERHLSAAALFAPECGDGRGKGTQWIGDDVVEESQPQLTGLLSFQLSSLKF